MDSWWFFLFRFVIIYAAFRANRDLPRASSSCMSSTLRPFVSGTYIQVKNAKNARKPENIKKVYWCNIWLRNSNDVPTRKFAVQLVAAATEFAAPRAPDEKSSETKNHGMEPGPVAKKITKRKTNKQAG